MITDYTPTSRFVRNDATLTNDARDKKPGRAIESPLPLVDPPCWNRLSASNRRSESTPSTDASVEGRREERFFLPFFREFSSFRENIGILGTVLSRIIGSRLSWNSLEGGLFPASKSTSWRRVVDDRDAPVERNVSFIAECHLRTSVVSEIIEDRPRHYRRQESISLCFLGDTAS